MKTTAGISINKIEMKIVVRAMHECERSIIRHTVICKATFAEQASWQIKKLLWSVLHRRRSEENRQRRGRGLRRRGGHQGSRGGNRGSRGLRRHQQQKCWL
ncbi:uncharacterized protein LOC143187205 [Calliopsis andreniformis]|uniref:uncharacterized protein LOC143187205 n=1 Tax=Calliopsis andreniformis TaxID=337506 RepID=UPI003FCE31DB